MPQLIAMVIVVVGAMIYMFQTFGGTGDKIESVAQKGSIITEINNIKDGVKIAARSGNIGTLTNKTEDLYSDLKGLAELSYFAEQINTQLTDADNDASNANIYNAISFGGKVEETDTNESAMQISIVTNKEGMIPGIFVDLSQGSLKTNAAFLESQIANDLSAIAQVNRKDVDSTTTRVLTTGGSAIENRIPVEGTAGNEQDGMFTIYFKDFGANEIVKSATAP